jgi:hypothetical protein
MMNCRTFFIFLFLWLCFFPPQSLPAAHKSLQTSELEVFYEGDSLAMAEEVMKMFPDVKDALKKSLSWETNFKPQIVLIRDRDAFVRAAGSEIFLAYAVPRRYLIVLDASRVYSKPFTLETTLMHEMCHLLLHHSIANRNLPRWLDEGICQWASGGISELLATNGGSALARAITADTVMRIKDLETFPKDEASLVLAYEQSKSLIEYINSRYGHDSILRILAYAREGYPAEQSLQKSLSVGLPELEQMWQEHLRGTYSWFSYLSSHLYTILFVLAGLITIYGFIRFLKKKREYADEEEGDAF